MPIYFGKLYACLIAKINYQISEKTKVVVYIAKKHLWMKCVPVYRLSYSLDFRPTRAAV